MIGLVCMDYGSIIRKSVLRYLPWLVTLLFLSMMVVFETLNLIGFGQRLFLLVVFGWLILTARDLQTGAFAVDSDFDVPHPPAT